MFCFIFICRYEIPNVFLTSYVLYIEKQPVNVCMGLVITN